MGDMGERAPAKQVRSGSLDEASVTRSVRPERVPMSTVIVDVNLYGTSWLDLARTASARWPEVPVLIVSAYDDCAYDDCAYVTAALEIGVRATC